MRTVERLQFLFNRRHRTLTICIWGHWRNQFGRDLNLFAVGRKPCTNRRLLAARTQELMVKREEGHCGFYGRGSLRQAGFVDICIASCMH